MLPPLPRRPVRGPAAQQVTAWAVLAHRGLRGRAAGFPEPG